MSNFAITEKDKIAWASVQEKLRFIKEGVRKLTDHLDTGLLLWGEGGLGKSFAVEEELKKTGVPYKHTNSRITPRALVDTLRAEPYAIHFLEDVETLLEDKNSHGVLRSALWSQSTERPRRRLITWATHKTNIRFDFFGSIIMVANSNISETIPAVRAIRSRINIIGHDLSDSEIIALMKTQMCKGIYRFGEDFLTEEEKWRVAEFIIENLNSMGRPLDLRLLQGGFHDCIHDKSGKSELPWQDMVLQRMTQRAPSIMSKSENRRKEEIIFMRIHGRSDLPVAEKIKLFQEQTGKKGNKAWYRVKDRLLSK